MVSPIGLTSGIFLLIGVGALAKRIGLLKYADRVALNNIIIFISLPALIFTASRQASFESALILVAIVSLSISALTLLISYGVASLLRLRGPLKGAFLLASGVGNTGYLGYPLAQALFGQEHLVKAVFFDIFGTVVILFTAGIYFANRYGQGTNNATRQAVTYAAPNLAGLLLGFATAGVTLPLPIDLAITSLAQSTTGVIMLSIGLSLSSQFGREKLAVVSLTALKLAVMPVIAIGAILLLEPDPVVGGVILLQSSMPVALMTFVIGDKYELDRDFLSSAILLSTLLSMATIPIWQSVASVLLP